MKKVLVLLLILIPSVAFAITIDDFNSGNAESSVSTSGDTAHVSVVASSAIGGIRHQIVTKAGGALDVTLQTVAGLLTHSLDVTTTGSSRIIWNASSVSSNEIGLAGIDTTQDILNISDSDGFRIDVVAFDIANNQPLSLTLIINSTDGGSSYQTQTLNSGINSLTPIIFPINNFIPIGSQAANFTKTGSIILDIAGSGPNSDLAIDSISTTGCSSRIPTATSARIIDRCEICEGDGNSCCSSFNVKSNQRKMDGAVKKFAKFANKVLRKIRKKSKKGSSTRIYARDGRKMFIEYGIAGWKKSWEPESIGEMCSETKFCVATSNVNTLNEYREISQEILDEVFIAIQKFREVGGNLKRANKFETKANKLHATNLALSDNMPEHVSSCR